MPNLYAQQEEGAAWLYARRRAYLADAPGQGKTPQAIIAATRLGITSPLVICPAIAREMWRRQWLTWGVPSVVPTVLSYDELVRSPLTHMGGFDLLILDEVHRCRNVTAQRTKRALTLANKADRVWLLSGTPMPNHVGNLYPMLRAVWPDLLPKDVRTYAAFLGRYATTIPTEWGVKVVGLKNLPELRAILDAMMLRREHNAQLPPLRWESFYLPQLPEAFHASLTTDEAVAWQDSNVSATTWDDAVPHSAAFSTARRLLGEVKAGPVGRMIAQELADNAYPKIVVLAHHRAVLNTLQDCFAGFGVARIDGDTNDAARNYAIARFQNNPECRVFLAQLGCVQETITLTAAAEIALVEQSWAPDENYQAVKRIHRIGQEQQCRARSFYAPCPLDEAVERVNARKLVMRGEVLHS